MAEPNEIEIIQNQLSKIIELLKSVNEGLAKIQTAVERLPKDLQRRE